MNEAKMENKLSNVTICSFSQFYITVDRDFILQYFYHSLSSRR